MKNEDYDKKGTALDHFIVETQTEFFGLCDDIIEAFDKSKNTFDGLQSSGSNNNVKNSTDQGLGSLVNNDIMDKYVEMNLKYIRIYLDKCVSDATGKNMFGVPDFTFINPSVQKYKQNEGHFIKEHFDGDGKDSFLVSILYLNDVVEGGETEFPEFGIKVKPKKAKLVQFPAFFTHKHKGLIPISGDKYIITWYTKMK